MMWVYDLLTDVDGKIVAYAIHQLAADGDTYGNTCDFYCMSQDTDLNNSLKREALTISCSATFGSQEKAKAAIESERKRFHHTLD